MAPGTPNLESQVRSKGGPGDPQSCSLCQKWELGWRLPNSVIHHQDKQTPKNVQITNGGSGDSISINIIMNAKNKDKNKH